ncbi:lef-8 [Adoxophyes orana granulovirus]|uniref:Late expression factor 8 n=4 Tax=Adoxophyes orana granulovirus TaxID=170617 RepID=Q7T9Q5_GVAO|nr:lef-8 [Adoxophyes orana granulovirus]AAP85747.1 lef-8 [Adoxophyes orana granulovirus]AJA91751.1 late expression factor 8 [Adoxophyes orana granulovirus]
MCNVVEDFDNLYNILHNKYNLTFSLYCQTKFAKEHIKLNQIKSYFCCAISECRTKCVLHNCVVVIIGTWLDKMFRNNEQDYGFTGTFVIDSRHFSFPNIMMNNNVLVHNFFDKQYARNKKMKRIFLYGNYDDDRIVNRAIQLVYDKIDDVLYVRDVYAKDYIVDIGINKVLEQYLKSSGKWFEMDFAFEFSNSEEIFDKIKTIMSVDINFEIDSLSNKIIYKYAYLLRLTYVTLLNKYKHYMHKFTSENMGGKKKVILFASDSKKIYDTILSGKLIQSVSKTLSKQKKHDQDYNSNNNNLEVFPLRHRIGSEVLRIINENLQQDMLKHTKDYVKFVDSFFHGEMTVAGKKFFLCHNTRLPDLNYEMVGELFKKLETLNVFTIKPETSKSAIVAFNNRPTKYYCDTSTHLYKIYYLLKRNYCPIEIKLISNILFINHHEGMLMLKKVVCIDSKIKINTLQTPYEYHNVESVVNKKETLLDFDEIVDNTQSLMSTMILEYYKDHLHIFNTIPVAKLIVSLTNLKNGMVVNTVENRDCCPLGNSVVLLDNKIYCNDRMFYLWTIVMDNCLKTAEDPYIPHVDLPIEIYHNKINRLRGKLFDDNTDSEFKIVYKKNESSFNAVYVDNGNYLCLFGTLICSNKINWNHDGKKYKIEYCISKQWHVYKFYMYFRKVNGQQIHKIDSEMCHIDFNVYINLELIYSVKDLEGLKICGVHGQKGVLSASEDLSVYISNDGSGVHAQICLSPVSYLSRQTNFLNMPVKYYESEDGKLYPIIRTPYMFFNNTPDNIYKEFIGKNVTGYEKLEGTRLDQWSINQSFMGNRMAESLHCVRGGNNNNINSGQYNVFRSLLHCNNIKINENV